MERLSQTAWRSEDMAAIVCSTASSDFACGRDCCDSLRGETYRQAAGRIWLTTGHSRVLHTMLVTTRRGNRDHRAERWV